MSWFKRKQPAPVAAAPVVNQGAALAELVLNSIEEGVIITDAAGVISSINPAAVAMLECGNAADMVGLDYRLHLKIENKGGQVMPDAENPVYIAVASNQPLNDFKTSLAIERTGKHLPVSLSVIIAGNNKIIKFRDITKDLEEDSAQAEFISTASHEMRTPVASIEGYLSLALNAQTATIDDRARKYLESAHAASQHLGKLFQDLLDTTKLDDGRIKPEMVPTEVYGLVKQMAEQFMPQFLQAQIKFDFGSSTGVNMGEAKVQPAMYAVIDTNFLQEIMNNLLDNARKYSLPDDNVWVNVVGDERQIVISVKDTGIGISQDDIQHVFQKFYRADNSDTRTIGGTGLGLYITKQRVEAMGGKIWAESTLGSGTTFYVSLPRLSTEEYNRRITVMNNQKQFMEVKA